MRVSVDKVVSRVAFLVVDSQWTIETIPKNCYPFSTFYLSPEKQSPQSQSIMYTCFLLMYYF